MIDKLYTADAAALRLGTSARFVRSLAQRLGLPRRMDHNPPHGYKRVYTTSDLEKISALRVTLVTQRGHRNPGLKRSAVG